MNRLPRLPRLPGLPGLPRLHALLVLTLACGATAPALAATTVADWTFAEAAGRTLNLTANTGTGVGGAGGSWDVAIPGVATTGSGALAVRNAGGGGSGTRTAYADFGPVAGGTVTGGVVTLYTALAGWNLAGASGVRLQLALIAGNDFATASFTLAASGAGLALGSAADGDGNAPAAGASFAGTSAQPLTLRLSLDLDALRYGLAYDAGSGFIGVGDGGRLDSATQGVNSLRLSLAGDFSVGGLADRGLLVDRIWVETGPLPAVPEPAPALLALTGALLLWLRLRAAAPAVVR